MSVKKRVMGLTLFSVGLGMLLVVIVPGWGWILAVGMVVLGYLFLAQR